MIIGITGGLGSGKSTVSGYLESKYGFGLLSADDIAKELEKPGGEIYRRLVDSFGDRILLSSTSDEGDDARPIAREAFARLIYSDREALIKADEIIHPAVWRYISQKTSGPGNYVIETALPDEDFPDRCDEVWCVLVDEETRIKRLEESRGYTRKKSESIMNNQLKEKKYLGICDKILYNHGSIRELYSEVDELMRDLGLSGE